MIRNHVLIEQSVRTVLDVAIRTFTTGSFANDNSLGKKKEAKSAGLMPASSKDRQICVNLFDNS
jgi:hypothetical protein